MFRVNNFICLSLDFWYLLHEYTDVQRRFDRRHRFSEAWQIKNPTTYLREMVMKQRFEILLQGDKLVIKEYAELDKEMMSLLCEETYDRAAIAEAVANGTQAVMAAVRTKNMYPPRVYAERISEEIVALFASPSEEPVEIVINDLDLLMRGTADAEIEIEEAEEEEADIDDLLEDDIDNDDDNLDDEIAVKKIKSSLKVADDEIADMDDDL